MTTTSGNPRLGREDALRAGTYSLLGALLVAPPTPSLLARVAGAGMEGSRDGIGRAWSAVALAARQADPHGVGREYDDVFIGVAQGEITPYASWYLTGSLMEKPLIALRRSLRDLGIERHDGVKEPEDHAGALLEAMALLVDAVDVSFEQEQEFFQTHLEPWILQCFTDMQNAPSAAFYRSVGLLGAEFVGLESQYYRMAV